MTDLPADGVITVQISLDLTSIDEALAVADVAVRAGVQWLEAGTPWTAGRWKPISPPARARHSSW
jgi:hypothetical protein